MAVGNFPSPAEFYLQWPVILQKIEVHEAGLLSSPGEQDDFILQLFQFIPQPFDFIFHQLSRQVGPILVPLFEGFHWGVEKAPTGNYPFPVWAVALKTLETDIPYSDVLPTGLGFPGEVDVLQDTLAIQGFLLSQVYPRAESGFFGPCHRDFLRDLIWRICSLESSFLMWVSSIPCAWRFRTWAMRR